MNVLYFHMPWSVFFNMYSKWNLVVCTVDFGQSHVKEAFLWESIWVSQQERREIHVCTRKSAYVSVPNWQAIATDDQQETIFIYLDKSKWLSFSSQAFCKRLKSFSIASLSFFVFFALTFKVAAWYFRRHVYLFEQEGLLIVTHYFCCQHTFP